MKMDIFSYVDLCSLVDTYRRFRGACYLHQHPHDGVGLHGAT
jgi:hypothetical protein